MGPLLLAALSAENYLEIGSFIFGGIGVGGLLLSLVFRGTIAKYGLPEMYAAITTYAAQPAQIEVRQAEIKRVIENEIRRDDGLIAREIAKKLEVLGTWTAEQLEELRKTQQDDQDFREATIADQAKIKSALNMLTRGSIDSVSNFHAVPQPKPRLPPPPPRGPDGTGGWKKKV